MPCSLKIKRSALKEIKALPNPERVRIVEAIDRLPENPHVGSVYRIVYEINEGQVLVLALRVAHRYNVYR